MAKTTGNRCKAELRNYKLLCLRPKRLLDIKKEISVYERSAAKDFTYQYFILKLAN